jgi:hypothetical protein
MHATRTHSQREAATVTPTRRRLAVATVAAVVAVAGAVGVHDFRTRVVASGEVDGHRWTLVARRGVSEQCLELRDDGVLTGGGCGFGGRERDATGSVAGHTVVFGPAPSGAATAVVDGVTAADVRVPARPLSWVPRRRVYVAVLPFAYAYGATRFEDANGREVG